MGQNKKIQILLSTYNGYKFIKAQLESILSQENISDIKILVRDDGSIDETKEYLKAVSLEYDFIEVIFGKNVGVNRSYFELLECADKNCDYFAFSDQDDIWLPFKMKRAMDFLDRVSEFQKPCLYSSRSEIVDENLEHIGEVLNPIKPVGFYNAVAQNVMPGHTQVFNRAALEMTLKHGYHKNIHVIDWWMYLSVAAMGEVFFDPDITVKHRQHSDNTVGYRINFVEQSFARIKRAFSDERNKPALQLKAFSDLYYDDMPEEYRTEVRSYLSGLKKFSDKIRYVISAKAYRQSGFETALFKVLYLFGKYKI